MSDCNAVLFYLTAHICTILKYVSFSLIYYSVVLVRSPVRYSTYRGAIEELMIGDEKVGLWNFKNAQNVAPAMERDRFIDLHTETGLRFQGNGYAILDRKQFPLRERSAITFRFKTRSKNGLIFLVGKGRKYMAIYMGKVFIKN